MSRFLRGRKDDEDAPPEGRRSVYEDRLVRRDAGPVDRAVWVKLAELGSDGLPLPGTVPSADWKESLYRQGWEPLEDRLRRRF